MWFGDKEKGIVWRKWSVCCCPKNKGGLGLRDLACFNQTSLAKVGWRIMQNPDSLLSKVLCGKGGFLNATATSSSSWGWRSILWGKQLLSQGLKWKIGNGNKVNVFEDDWIPKSVNPYRGTNVQHCLLVLKLKV